MLDASDRDIARAVDPSMTAPDGPARRAFAGLRWRASSTVRVLPDFLIVGAQKAGTSSLYRSLNSLPDVLPARKKEVRFFDRHWHRGVHWYRWNFPTRWTSGSGPSHKISGDATPEYLIDPRVPPRAAQVLPDCRVIVLLRQPVDRAFSQYQMNLRAGVESRSFADAIDGDLAELANEEPPNWSDARRIRSYVERSRYAPQLKRWLDVFPRESVYITTLEAMLADPSRELREITTFLGVDIGEHPVRFAETNRASYADLGPAERRRLFALFEDDLDETSRLIGRELPYRA